MPERVYRHATAQDAGRIADRLTDSWGETRAVGHGVVYDLTALPALLAESDGELVGVLTYQIDGDDFQIVSIDATNRQQGVGTGLIDAATARAAGCRRIWLTTTNDNLDALRFYQRRGFRLVALRPDAVRLSRRLKPSIPEIGAYGIAIRDELDLELPLSGGVRPEYGDHA
ncbi:MAG TPA: GNAT family N-acetyltransferase [Mycobacteriales bacterium]|jgi:ribosomal protein S18 acetylase RimI-like enzyme|nr:GNAT family N-acetyltransferase [Mycobacteriales bacterium]